MIAGPAGDQGHAREAIELAARRGWAGIPQTACAHTALALAAFFDLRPTEAAEHLERAAAASGQVRRRQLDFVSRTSRRGMQGATGAPREGLRILDEFEAAAPARRRAAVRARRRWPRCARGC